MKERSSTISLALIMAFRMMGLFMILPIFSANADKLIGSTPTLIGIALGVYGLTQAAFQIPFGTLSDTIGRKPVILLGLLLFAIGSVIGALSHSIIGIIIARTCQGMGAIGSTTLALLSDLTRDENRSKAMAIMGMTIGFAFAVAMIVGPVIFDAFGLSGIFWATAMLAILGACLLMIVVPTPPTAIRQDHNKVQARLRSVLKSPSLLRLDVGIFALHSILTALFIAVPLLLSDHFHLSGKHQSGLYLLVLFLAFLCMVPLIIVAEKRQRMRTVFLLAIATLTLTQIGIFATYRHLAWLMCFLGVFFMAFTLLESCLPSLISKIAPINSKGAAMGIYSSSQFLGIFVGGSLGGWLMSHFGLHGIFILTTGMGSIWLITALWMKEPPYLSTQIFTIENPQVIDSIEETLCCHPGIAEASVSIEENLIYLKVDKKKITQNELRKLVLQGNLGQSPNN